MDGWPDDEVTLDALSGPWRIHQRRKGHRWSVDDLLTAHVAVAASPSARTHLDLGCGIGSVLMLVAYRLRGARHVGVEAQAQSAALCRASLRHNGLEERVELRHADFRGDGVFVPGERFELVTGTPPYLPVGTATMPRDAQKAHARMELRGGVEAYCAAGARVLADGGTMVVCADGRTPGRTEAAARAAGLHVHARLDLVPLPGKPVLLHVVTLRRAPAPEVAVATLVARTVHRRRTRALQAVRAAFDMPPMPGEEEDAA
jgi:tRNA1Val (adenine37-N6)-methyltransferase